MADIRDAFIVFSAKFYEKALNGKTTVPRLWEAEWQRRSVWRTTERTTGTELQQTNYNLGFIVYFQLIFKCGKSHGTKSGKEPNPLGWSFSLTCVVDVSTNPFLFMISTKERKKTNRLQQGFIWECVRPDESARARACVCVCVKEEKFHWTSSLQKGKDINLSVRSPSNEKLSSMWLKLIV